MSGAVTMVALAGRPLEQAVRQAMEAAAGTPRRAAGVSVLLSGALARPFVFGPLQGLRGWREAHAAAQAAAPVACGVGAPCEIWLDADPGAGPAMAVAVGRETIDAVYAAAGELKLDVRSIRPVWAWALDQRTPLVAAAGLVACRDPDAMVVLAEGGGSMLRAGCYLSAPGVTHDVQAQLRRSTLALDLDAALWRTCAMADVELADAVAHSPAARWSEVHLDGEP